MIKRERKPVSELVDYLLTFRYSEVRDKIEGQTKGGIDLKFATTSVVKLPEKQICDTFIKLEKTPSIIT